MENNERFYILYHSYENEEGNYEEKILGVYTNNEKALEALNKFKEIEGFKDYLEGFTIEESFLNEDSESYIEGFCHKSWEELEGVPFFTEEILNQDVEDVLKKYYNLENIPKGPGSEFRKLGYWKEEDGK